MAINSIDDLEPGMYFTTESGQIWVLESCCPLPTATLKNLETGERVGGAVSSLNLQPFIRLIPENEIIKRRKENI